MTSPTPRPSAEVKAQSPPQSTPARPPLPVVLARRTTDLIVIGFLAAASLTAGRQIIEWWHEDPLVAAPSAPKGVDPARLGAKNEPLLVEFGELPVRMYQVTLSGEPEEAWRALHNRVRDVLVRECSASSEHKIDSDQQSESERRILELASRLDPSEKIGVAGAVFRFSDSFAGAFSVRYGSGNSISERVQSGRLIAWGMLIPSGPKDWRIFQFERTGKTTAAGYDSIPSPPGGMRLLSTGSETAGRLIAFRGEGKLEDWQRFFTGWFDRSNWRPVRDWDRTAESSGALYRKTIPGGAEMAEIRLILDASDRLSAVVQIYRAGD